MREILIFLSVVPKYLNSATLPTLFLCCDFVLGFGSRDVKKGHMHSFPRITL